MFTRTIPVMVAMALGIFLGLAPARAQEKPVLVVHAFTLASDVKGWPYDMKKLQTQAVAEITEKDAAQFAVATEVPADQARVYVLDGEVQEWHKGNTAERMLIAMGSVAGRENAKIHYWLTDKDGKKVFEQTDTIRQGFMKNGHEKNTGTLTKPFGEKLAERLKEAKLVGQGS